MVKGKEENGKGMITAVTVNQGAGSSCQGETEVGGSQAMPTVEQEDHSGECSCCTGCLGGPGCSVGVLSGREGEVSFVRGVRGESLGKCRQWLQCNRAGNLVSNIRRD